MENKMEKNEWISDYTRRIAGDANTMFWQHSLMDDIAGILSDKEDNYQEHLSPRKLRETFALLASMVEVVE